MKKLLILIVLAALCAGGWFAWQKLPAGQAKEERVPQRFIARAEKRDIDLTVEVSGDVAPAFQLEVKPEVGGRIKNLHVEPGDAVKEGQVLVEIDDRDIIIEKDSAQTEIEGARLAADKATKNFERAKDLHIAKLISREVYDNLDSEHLMADNNVLRTQRKLALVEDKLRKTKVIAPMEGVVLTVPVIEGQVAIAAASVNNGTTLMTIANLGKLLVDTHVNQVDVAKLAMGQRVKLRAEALKDVEIEARISFIAPVATVKNNVKGFNVQAVIENPNPRLRPGMTVNLTIPIAHSDGALSVPVSAIFKGDGNKRVVYVFNGDTTEQREVKIGVSNIEHAEVLKGLNEGEQILLVEPAKTAWKSS